MFTRVGNILKSAPSRAKSADSMRALQVRQASKEVLDKVLDDYPEDIAKSVKIKTFKNGTLTIVSPTLLSAELHARSEELKKEINRVLEKRMVEKIRFRAVQTV